MATPRKTGAARSKASGTPKKAAKAAKKSSASPKRSASDSKSAASRAKPVKAAKPAVKAGAARSAAAAAKPARAAVAAVPAKRPAKPTVARKQTAEVRPLGVLPPSAMARSTPRPQHSTPQAHRTTGPRHDIAPRATTGDQRVSEKDMKEFEQRLLEERQRILKEMGHLENTVLKVNQRDSAGDLSGYSFHMADVGTDSMEREKAFLFASAEGRTLMEINEALRRLYRGEYGVCESCGQPIARARLEAMPHARLCVSCKEKEERARRGAS